MNPGECSECGPRCTCPAGMQVTGIRTDRARLAKIAELLGDMTRLGMLRADTQAKRDLLAQIQRLLK